MNGGRRISPITINGGDQRGGKEKKKGDELALFIKRRLRFMRTGKGGILKIL